MAKSVRAWAAVTPRGRVMLDTVSERERTTWSNLRMMYLPSDTLMDRLIAEGYRVVRVTVSVEE